MNPNALSGKPPVPLPRWLLPCVILGLVIGAGGLLPSLLGDGLRLPASGNAAGETAALPSPGAMFGRLAAGTVLVLALCAGTLPLLRRWLVARPAARAAAGGFEVVASLPLGGRSCVCLVRAGGQHLLAGVDGGGLQVLVPVGDLPAEASAAAPAAAAPKASAGRAPAAGPVPVLRRVPAGTGIDPRRVGVA